MADRCQPSALGAERQPGPDRRGLPAGGLALACFPTARGQAGHLREARIEWPTKFQLVVNQRAARALEIDLPASLPARANEVIE